ncbi:ZmpA/ZmpB/ZmpC family metallo-endopeptidase [Clostridium tertium]|uniref:ZmpA/ZmpB/ZmpC family metallo-endopeptidase n=1 Tax=Clostridium tertium TaxID=1559 RepID=UPI00374F2B62
MKNKELDQKVKRLLAVGSAVMIGVTSTLSVVPSTVFAKEIGEVNTEVHIEQEDKVLPDEELQKNDITENVHGEAEAENGEVIGEEIHIENNEQDVGEITVENEESNEDVEIAQDDIIVGKVVDGKEVAQLTKNILQSVKYTTDPTIANLLAPLRFSGVDILNKKLEISKRDNVPINSVTNEQAERELKVDNIYIMSFEDSFVKVQTDIENIIEKVIKKSKVAADYQGDANTYFIDKINQNKEKVLLGLTYLDRMYNFDIGNKNIKDLLLDTPEYFGKKVDLLDWVILIGGAGGETLKISNNQNAYIKLFRGTITDSPSLLDFLEENKNKLEPDVPMEQWFQKASNALIVEKTSKENPSATTALYSKLKSDTRLQSHILPLLNVSENSIYVTTNSATITYGLVDTYVDRTLKQSNPDIYQNKFEEFKKEVDKAANQQSAFIDFWYRIAKQEVRSNLQSNRLVIDSLRIMQSGQSIASKEWSPKFGSDAALGVKEFITPMNMYAQYFSAGGQAEGNNVRLFLSKALEEDGISTYSHELTHLLGGEVWLNQFKNRQGLEAEFYPRGLYETYSGKEAVLNLNFIYDHHQSDRTHNSSPERFQTEQDMQEYTQRLLDVMYTLDYAEANVVLTKEKADKQKWFHKLEQENDTRNRFNQGNPNATHKIDTIRKISLEEADDLKSINDLVEQNIVASRYEIEGLKTTGKSSSNGYYVIPLFTANYANVENDNGVSGDIMMRRQAYELLAEYGYYEGMVPYISNQYLAEATQDGQVLSDTYILNKVFKGQYTSMTDFKKAMFQKRIEKLDQLKPVSITWKGQTVNIEMFEQLNQLMEQAVEEDLNNVHELPQGWNNIRAEATQVELLKKAIFIAYINSTDDFNESIYRENILTKKYTVSFDKNASDAIGHMEIQKFEYGTEQALSQNQFQRKGYDFVGWKDAAGNIYTDKQIVNNLVEENDGQIILFAQWKPIEYQVKFHKNHLDAIGTMENQKMLYDQSYKLNQNTFTLDGYEFQGWATESDGQMKYKDQESVTKLTDKKDQSIDLYAVWEKKLNPEPPSLNKPPVIFATDKILTVGDVFDPLKGVIANDPEDGSILIKNEHVVKNEVKTDKPGIYQVTYRVADKEGLVTEKIITVVVNPKMEGLNHVPTINATDKVLIVGENFNPLDGVIAYDNEDGDITLTDNNIISNNVNMNVVGTYNVTYKVTDKSGASAIKTITVVVNPKMEGLNHVPTINAKDKVLTVGESFNPLDGVIAYDNEDGDITLTDNNIILNNVNMNVVGTYNVTYKVTDKSGASAIKTITVVVNPKMEVLNNVPIINATDKVLIVGENFNPLDRVTAYDEEDGEITIKDENIIKNTVDISKVGTYEVVYKVTDKMGASITKTITVIVNEKNIVESKPESAKPSIGGNATINKLPNTGFEGSLPILGVWLIALGSILVNKKKNN